MSRYRIGLSGLPKRVKNLGWLVAQMGKGNHAERVEVCVYVPATRRVTGKDAALTVWLADGKVFQTEFASTVVLREWLRNRRNLRGVPLQWGTIETTCDSDAINPKKHTEV